MGETDCLFFRCFPVPAVFEPVEGVEGPFLGVQEVGGDRLLDPVGIVGFQGVQDGAVFCRDLDHRFFQVWVFLPVVPGVVADSQGGDAEVFQGGLYLPVFYVPGDGVVKLQVRALVLLEIGGSARTASMIFSRAAISPSAMSRAAVLDP